MGHWFHRCYHQFQHIFAGIRNSEECCCQLHAGFVSLVGWWCSEIVLRGKPSLYHGRCTDYSFIPLVEWKSLNFSPWCVNSSFSWEFDSCHDRIDHPWSSRVSFSVVCGRNIHTHIDCYMSPGGASVPIWVIGCWLSPLDCTKQDLSIHEGHQYYLCMLHLHWNGHVNISCQEHLWCLADIYHWWRHCMLTDFWESTNFHQYRLILQQPGWYRPRALC